MTNEALMSPGTIIINHPAAPATDKITQAGLVECIKNFEAIAPEVPQWQKEMLVTLWGRDWSHGHEERVMTSMQKYVDLTGAYRLCAAMVAGSKE